METNVEIPKGYSQVLVAESVEAPKNEEEIEFIEKTLEEVLGCKIKYLECILTLPDKNAFGEDIPDTGGRSDIFLVIEENYPEEVAFKRFSYGLRYVEDVIANNIRRGQMLHPDRIKLYQTWDASIPGEIISDLLQVPKAK